MDLSPQKRRNWWSHTSLISATEKLLSLDKKIQISKQISQSDAKHTFFPGEEANRKRFRIFSKIVIDADSRFKICWDLLITLASIAISLIIPYSLSFFQDINPYFWIIISTLFSIDLILNFNISYYSEGILVKKHRRIAKNYLKGKFFIDLLGGFPFEIFYMSEINFDVDSIRTYENKSEYMRFLLLLKIIKLYKIPNFLYQVQIHYPEPFIHTSMKILNYLLLILLPAHWMCCIFNCLYAYYFKTSYLYVKLEIDDCLSRYLRFFEKVIQTMTSVGYGDFLSLTPLEKMFNIFVMSFTSGFLGVFVGGVILAIEQSTQNTLFFRDALRKFSKFYNRHEIPKPLRSRISFYIRHLKHSYNNNLLKEEDIIRMLSIPLREQIFLYTRGYLLGKIIKFNELSRGFLKALGYKMALNFYAPDDLIFRQGENTSDLYFIFSGTVTIFHEQTGTKFITLSKNSFFGEISFFMNQGRTASGICNSFSEIFALSLYHFDKILKSMPKDYEKIMTLRRNMKTYGLVIIGVKCYFCKELGHVATDCLNYLCRVDMDKVVHFSQQKREKTKNNNRNFKRPEVVCSYFNNYSKSRVKGFELKSKESFKKRKYLNKKILMYNSHVKSVQRENSRLFTLLNEVSAENSHENHSEESNESEKNFLEFSITKIEKRNSTVNADVLSFVEME